MKKSISLILVFLLLFALGACNTPVEDDPPEEPFVGEELKILTYYQGDGGIILPHCGTKTLSDEWTQGLIQALIQAPETGETADKISDKEITEFSAELPVPDQTKWFITGNYIFRLIDNRLYRVDSHLGAGKELEYSEELQKMVYDASHYAPYNSYRGTWKNGTLEVEHVFENKSTVDIRVEEIKYTPSKENKHSYVYTAKLILVSSVDQAVKLRTDVYASEDNRGGGDCPEVVLKKGEETPVEIKIYGFPFSFSVSIIADNTKFHIKMSPN